MALNNSKLSTVRRSLRFSPRRVPAGAGGHRDFWVSALAVIFFLLAAAGWLRVQQTIEHWDLLAEWGIWPGPLYNALSGVAWGAVGLPAAWGLWFRQKWAPRFIWIAALFYPAIFWLDRLLIAQSPEARTGWPFWLVATLLWLGYILVVLRSRAAHLIN
jgi:hypothetical protein